MGRCGPAAKLGVTSIERVQSIWSRILPAAAALPYAGALRIATRPLQEDWAVRPLALCTRAPRTLPAAARVLISHLMQCLPAP